MKVTRHLRISGLVQGVGYRAALHAEARARGISGWVRNRRDGTVEAVLQGSPADVDAVLAWANRGPCGARVTRVDVQPAQGEMERSHSVFEFLPTE